MDERDQRPTTENHPILKGLTSIETEGQIQNSFEGHFFPFLIRVKLISFHSIIILIQLTLPGSGDHFNYWDLKKSTT